MAYQHPASTDADGTFTAQQAVAAGIDFAELQASALGLFWNQYDPADGACRLWRWHNGKPH